MSLIHKPTKQQLANSVGKALAKRADEIEVVRNRGSLVCYSTFDTEEDLQQRKELLEFLGQELYRQGAFSQTAPKVTVSGNQLIVRFFQPEDFRKNSPMGGVYSNRKSDNKRVGPYTNRDLNPLFQPARPSKKSNNYNRTTINDHVEGASYTQEAAAEKFSYDDIFDMWNDVEQASYNAAHGVDTQFTDVGHIEDSTITSPEVHTRKIAPRSVDKTASFSFINEFGRAFQNLGSDPRNAKTKTAHHQWLHFNAALGLVAQTEVIGAMDRLQNDRGSQPCSMVWITNCLAGRKNDPEIQVGHRGWYKSTKRTIKNQTRYLCNIQLDGKAGVIFQLNKSVQNGFYCYPDRDNRPASIKVTRANILNNGHYAGLSWI